MFAVIFDLEGQFDCTLHETKAGADAEAARLSEKYAAERASYSASVAVQAVQLPPAYIEAPAMLAALRKCAAALGEIDDYPKACGLSPDVQNNALDEAFAILARIDGTPTAQPAAPTKGIAETVAAGLWRAKAVKEITARKAPKKFAPVFAGIKWAAFSIACEMRGLDPEFDRAGFMAAAGYPGEF